MNWKIGRMMQIFHFKMGFALALRKLLPELSDEHILKIVDKIK